MSMEIPDEPEESWEGQETPEQIPEVEMMAGGLKHLDTLPMMIWERKEKLELARQDPTHDREFTEHLENQISELTQELDGWSDILGVQVGQSGFRGYTEEEALAEAVQIQKRVKAGDSADYHEAEHVIAEVAVENLLQQGKGWEAIRIAIESNIFSNDIMIDAHDSVDQFMEQARHAGNIAEYEWLKEELRRIEDWRRQ